MRFCIGFSIYINEVAISSAHPTNFPALKISHSGTQFIKKIGQKKNGFLIMLSELSIAIKYDQFLNYYKF
jgi:hypothetical protein